MNSELSLMLVLLLFIALLSLLKIEKLVKMTFGTFVMTLFSLALVSLMMQGVEMLRLVPDAKYLGLSASDLASFLLNAQPTLMLLVYVLGVRFFTQSSHLSVQISHELFLQKLQTLLWAFLGITSAFCGIYFSLAFFKGAMYEWIFSQEIFSEYLKRIPLLGVVVSGGTLFAASQINIRFSFKKESPHSPL